jgi:hypothetical protein
MKATAVVLLLVLCTVYVILADHLRAAPALREPPTNLAEAETARLQRHLARVELELLAKDITALSPSQRSARRGQIRRLREYRLAGRFPHNHQFPGRRVPYFTDQHGTLCAMAYLIASSGARDVVDQISRSANNASVLELASDPVLGGVLGSWLEKRGLTVEEAQRIQPAYSYELPQAPKRISVAYGAGSGAVGALNIASVVLNSSDRNSRRPGWIPWAGLAAGSAGVVMGSSKLEHANPVRTLGIANIIVGATSIVASASALLRTPDRKLADAPKRAPGLSVTVMAGVDPFSCPVAGVRATF